MKKSLADRFWAKVDKNGPIPTADAVRVHPDIAGKACWLWTASVDPCGYGRIGLGGSGNMKAVTHVSLFLKSGRWPTKQVRHKCDNPPCVNPDHLFEGDPQADADDKIRKGRQAKGQINGLSILTEKQVLTIRLLFKGEWTRAQLARKFKVDWHTVNDIITRYTWKHI